MKNDPSRQALLMLQDLFLLAKFKVTFLCLLEKLGGTNVAQVFMILFQVK